MENPAGIEAAEAAARLRSSRQSATSRGSRARRISTKSGSRHASSSGCSVRRRPRSRRRCGWGRARSRSSRGMSCGGTSLSCANVRGMEGGSGGFGFPFGGDPEDLLRGLREFAEQQAESVQEAQREQFATLTLNTAVELTSAALVADRRGGERRRAGLGCFATAASTCSLSGAPRPAHAPACSGPAVGRLESDHICLTQGRNGAAADCRLLAIFRWHISRAMSLVMRSDSEWPIRRRSMRTCSSRRVFRKEIHRFESPALRAACRQKSARRSCS